eukprot:Skav222237  [mRNA]  locus=scaffold3059:80285:81736:- [translate_table: standard]
MVSHSAMREANPNIFSMLSLREVTAVKRRHFQANAAWVHRYELKSVLAGHQGCVNTVHWSGDVLVSGSDDMTVKLWRLPGSTPQVVGPVSSLPTGHRHNIFDAHLTSTQQVVSCGADGFVCKTSLDGFHQQLFAPAGGFRTPFAFKMDFLSEGQVFLVSFGDGKVRHFDLRAEGHTVAVNSDDVGLVGLAVEPHGNSLALGGNDPFLRIYDLRALSFHQEGSIVNMITTPVVSLHSTSSMVRNHKRWGGACRFFAPSNEICISGVCWDMGGRRLLANYRGGDIELFDFRKDLDAESEVPGVMEVFDSSLPTSCVQVNSSIRSYQGRINEQTCAKEVRFICQGAAVASGGDCGHFYIWSTDSGDLLRKLPADRCVVNSVAPHAQLPLVATSGIDAEIKTWDVDKVTERFSQPAAPAAGRAPAAPVDVGAAVELQEEGEKWGEGKRGKVMGDATWGMPLLPWDSVIEIVCGNFIVQIMNDNEMRD